MRSNEADNQTERPADGWSQFAEFGRSGALSSNTPSPQQTHENRERIKGRSLRLPIVGPSSIFAKQVSTISQVGSGAATEHQPPYDIRPRKGAIARLNSTINNSLPEAITHIEKSEDNACAGANVIMPDSSGPSHGVL